MDIARPLTLFQFQEDAATSLRTAALDWVAQAVATGVPSYGTSPIPFVGQLKAVTGAGKTPILASVVSGLGDAVVIWTSRSAAVVEQTFSNLRTKYRSLLPAGDVTIIRDVPGQADWHRLTTSSTGLTIWLLTTASWNEAESAATSGAADARLNLHRPHPDWAGDSSPWSQLRSDLKRPLWIVSDESHNQTDTQLDQLAALRPVGFFMASATPVHGELFDEWQKVLAREPEWSSLSARSQVPVRTSDVVGAQLLKTTVEVIDYQSGTEESLDGALSALESVRKAAVEEGASVSPRAIYVVERSNPPRGSLEPSRPVVIWRHLVERGVDPKSIAIFTDTKELPAGAQRISSLTNLLPRHTHIIFNQALQEGWDDPEAFVCYFDGVTGSFIRIRQIVGRVLRQPSATRFEADELNTATLILNTPSDAYEKVVGDLRRELRLYAPEDEPNVSPIRIKTRKNPLPPEDVKPKYAGNLQIERLSLRAPKMSEQAAKLHVEGKRSWPDEGLESPGIGRRSVLDIEHEKVGQTELLHVLRSARTQNGVYFRRRLANRNRNALNALNPDSYMKGPAFDQLSCQGSAAQAQLADMADVVAAFYEDRVVYDVDPDPDLAIWYAGPHRPRNSNMVPFRNAAHSRYSRGNFNDDEWDFAQALDDLDKGVWLRNGEVGSGYFVPLPMKAGDSLRFFPDFIWWPSGSSGTPWAIDTTGRHLLHEKVRGKLVGITNPRLALVVRGEVDLVKEQTLGSEGWSAVVGRAGLSPLVEHRAELSTLLTLIADQ